MISLSGSVSNDDLVLVGLSKQLLVYDHVIAEKQNISHALGTPKKYGVVMKSSVPTDFYPTKSFSEGLPDIGYHDLGYRMNIIWNGQRRVFQMLYRASAENLTGYAESKDGIHWTMTLISHDRKSNLISHFGKTQGTFYEASFMINRTVPQGHPEKYKAAFNPGNVKCAIAYSADGIHQERYSDGDSVTGSMS